MPSVCEENLPFFLWEQDEFDNTKLGFWRGGSAAFFFSGGRCIADDASEEIWKI